MKPDVPCCRPLVLQLRFCRAWVYVVMCLGQALGILPARASLNAYDSVIVADAGGGLTPLARMTNAVILFGTNKAPFNFGANAGDVTIEFVLEGNPNVGSGSAYLAVGANTSSNLRYEQWSNTGQLGFTQLGVADYLFAPAVPSPNLPVHIAYVWQAAAQTMKLYLNGSLAGSRSGVSTSFAMPTGAGWLGANPSTTETMAGTVYRVTVYDDVLSDAAILRHADAYNDVVRPPVIVSFVANPPAVFFPDSTTLSWNVQNFTGLWLGGMDVTALTNAVVSPVVTTVYSLVATNAGAGATSTVTVVVNPAPVIHSFSANRRHVAAGAPVTLSWNSSYGDDFSIAPAPGNVTGQTINGAGSAIVHPAVPTTYVLTVTNVFGSAASNVVVEIVHPAAHLVISEFQADNESTLADDDGDFSDWIEIHNPTAGPINLQGYFLTDDKADPTRWAFPNVTLPAGGYLLVWASEKNRINPAAPLHTNFQLEKAGEYLALIGPGPVVVHKSDPFPAQLEDASYGILGGDPAFVRSMGQPTPGAENIDTPPPPAPVQFSRGSGMFAQTFLLTLSNATPGAVIRYTLNGSVPSATNGTVYSGTIAISSTRRVRAVALANGRASRPTGESYIKLGGSLINYSSTLPILVIENFGAGVIPQKGWSGNGSGIKQFPRQDAVWATFERVGGASTLIQAPQMWNTIGIRGRGAFSSTWRQKPYSVEALDESGAERKVSPLGLPAHADWVLYFPDPDNNKDPSLLFNTFAYELYRNAGHDNGVRFRWVETFVNEDGGDLQLADRRGVYAIIEKVSRGEGRLDFARLSTNGATGGWLLNLNRMDPEPETGWPAPNGATQPWFFHTAGPNRILETPPNAQRIGDDEPQQSNGYLNFDNPSGYEVNSSQRAAIEGWFTQFEDVLWNNALWRDPANGYRKYLDPVDFADFFVLNVLTHNGDGLLISMFPWKGDDGRLRMGPAWDFNWSAYNISGSPTVDLLWRSDRLWYRRLFADVDFTQLYIDRWWDHRRGAMSNAGMEAIIDGQTADISPAKALLNGMPSTAEWTNRLVTMKTWLTNRANWIDSNYLRPPTFNQNGGPVPDGFQVTILSTGGTIYFTTDGSDPRAPGGTVAATAQAFQLPFTITAQTLVQARVRNGANWSALTKAVFYPPQDLSKLVVTEIMFNPPPMGVTVGDELEFLELKNTGTTPLQLGTLSFSAGITFTFTNATQLGPDQFFVLARNAGAFASKYPGVAVNGLYSGRLDNSGETLRLSTPFGFTVLSVTYNERAPWPVATDGHGFSLVPKNAIARPNSDYGADWRSSSASGGSPGADDPPPVVPFVLVNEVMTHTDLPAIDWIELFNPTATAVNIGGWFLSDDAPAPKKFRIPDGTSIDAGGYWVFDELDFNVSPESLTSFSLSSAGDSVYLSSGDASTNLTGYSHGFAFGAAANGVTFGRYVNSAGEEQFPAQLLPTPWAANVGPRVGPVVISEIHYHPEAGGDEFIELRNVTGGAVDLFDPMRPANTWRIDGAAFTFPTNITIPEGGVLLLVGSEPDTFRTRYGVTETVPILGPLAGVLQDSGERLELQRPDAPDTNGIPPFITVDAVRYNDKAPWPSAADGSGASLQRVNPAAYGDDPVNWQAAVPTPGAAFMPGQPPVILSQPQGRIVQMGQSVEFSVGANGALPLRFQWLFNSSPLAGATNPVLSLVNVQTTQAGLYSVVVFNDAGSVASAAAPLTVHRPPTILVQPTNSLVRPGFNGGFSVTAVGSSALRYQWRLNGNLISGATNFSLTISNAQFTNEGTYSVLVSDIFGETLSTPASLIILVDPLIVEHPVSQTVVTGSTIVLSVTVTNTATLPIGFRLRRNSATLPATHPGAYLVTTQRTIFFTLSGTNVAPPWTSYGFLATNLARPTGAPSTSAALTYVADTDGDGLPDPWETNFFGSTIADRLADSDGDGSLNWQEYIAGTDPTDPLSYLRIEALPPGAGAAVSFLAIAARTYSVQFTEALDLPWQTLDSVPARTTNRVVTLADRNYRTNRFYRLATPQAP